MIKMSLMILLVGLVLNQPSKAYAENICFEESTAKSMLFKLYAAEALDGELQELQIEFDQQQVAYEKIRKNLFSSLELCEKQSQDEHDRAEKYRNEWKECGEALTKCQSSKPSRTTWFGFGFGSGIALSLLLILL